MSFILTPSLGHEHDHAPPSRRLMIGGLAAAGAAGLSAPPLFAQEARVKTPSQTLGPFYPTDWTGDADNDLVVVQGEAAKAMGQIVHVTGRVLRLDGQPVADAEVEIWQVDSNGVYRHPRDRAGEVARDAAFQGRGRTTTDASGKYAFRTIRPVPYPGRTPHIHFKVEPPGGAKLVTQMYVFGEPGNERDGILNDLGERERESVIVKLEAADALEQGALGGVFDIVVA